MNSKSEKQILASRANGALSRGPKTPEGKAKSSQNAIRHGMFAKCVILTIENAAAFQDLLEGYYDRFRPRDEVERGLVDEMVAASWRLRRAFTIEMNMLEKDMSARPTLSRIDCLTTSFGDLAGTPKLAVLHRYQNRLHLIHSRAIRDLAALRDTVSLKKQRVQNEPSKSLKANKWSKQVEAFSEESGTSVVSLTPIEIQPEPPSSSSTPLDSVSVLEETHRP
jgi:hypothetical protein